MAEPAIEKAFLAEPIFTQDEITIADTNYAKKISVTALLH